MNGVCTRCGHPIEVHDDRAFVACDPRQPNIDSNYGRCWCPGYTEKK